jgi:hypothetical protein
MGAAKQSSRPLGETRRSSMLEWLREEGSARVFFTFHPMA